MRYTPFGLPIPSDEYDFERGDEATELELFRRFRDAHEADDPSESNYSCENFFNGSRDDLALELQERTEPQETSACTDSVQQNEKQEIGSSKRAQRLSKLADEVVESGRLLMTEGGQAFAYQESGGYFRPVTDLSAYIADFFGKDKMSCLLERDVHEIEKRLSWDSCVRCNPDDYNHHPEMVNLVNGVCNMETSELLPHDASFRFTYQIHAKYLENESDIDCPVFERFCATSLEGDPRKRQLLLEFIGYICADTNDGKCALFLKGQPNSGKSVILSFISKLFDSELVSSIPLHQLGDRFFRAELFGKKLNVSGEVAGRALRDISIFKSITGNDRIPGEFKGKDPFYFTPHCKLLFSGNTLPTTSETDTTAAFVNRIRVLLFNVSVPTEKQDKQLLGKLWDERDSIVSLALRTVKDLEERNFEFTMPKDSKEFLNSFALRSNLLQGFLDECCILDPNAHVLNVHLCAALESYCERNGLKCLTRNKFYDLLSGIPNVFTKRFHTKADNRWGHVGLRLKKEEETSGTMERLP